MRLALLFALLVLAAPAHANDSTAELGTGGLVLTKTADIDMRSEDLFISEKAVRVRYHFFNHSPTDVTTRVAFPLPDVVYPEQDSNIAIPDTDADNFLDFATRINGAPVVMELEQKAFAKGVDQTGYLHGLGIPLAIYLDATTKALDNLPKAKWPEMIRLGLGEETEYGGDNGAQKHLEPRWTLKSTYHWNQTFPAGKEMLIEHEYKPSVGSSAGTSVGTKGWDKKEEADYRRNYCPDNGVFSFVQQAMKKAKTDYPPLSEARIEYVLKTGANWASPIGDFKLTIDKGAAENLISVCGEGWKKTTPTQFELHKTDFTPAQDFYLLILKPRNDN